MKFSSLVLVVSVLASAAAIPNPSGTTTSFDPDPVAGPARRFFPEGTPAPLPTDDVSPASTWTNAERLRRGMLPKAPRAPTPAKRSAPSPTHYSGNIVVTYPSGKSGPLSGTNYLASHPTKYGFFNVTNVQSQALSVSFSASGSQNFDMKISQPTSPSLPYVGAISGYDVSSKDLNSSSGAYAAFGVCASASDGKPDKEVPNGFTTATKEKVGVETDIWSYSVATKTLTATWTNSDGQAASNTSIQYVEDDEFFVLTSNPELFAKDYGKSVISGITFQLSN